MLTAALRRIALIAFAALSRAPSAGEATPHGRILFEALRVTGVDTIGVFSATPGSQVWQPLCKAAP